MSQLVDDLLADQRRTWQQGKAKLVEQYLIDYPLLSADEEGTVDLIYQEFILRSELGPAPSLAEYVQRFPQYGTQLQAQLALLRVVQEIADQKTKQLDPAASASAPLSSCLVPESASAAPSLDGDQSATPNAAAADWPHLKGYDIRGELGRGAMGVVYKARQRSLRRLVALKMLHPDREDYAQGRARFRSEAEKLARLQHPNIVQIFEIGEQNGRPYFAMELVEGSSLAQKLAGARLPDGQAAQLVETLARAMHYAHQRGIIHRDLKPSNVLLRGDAETPIEQCALKIADFGLAKQLDAAGQTHSGMIVGTPSYMAPEQADTRPQAASPAVDVYALGAILYELLTGRPPFQAATPLQVLEQVRSEEPAPPSRCNARVARDLETICLKCLHKEPSRRYGSAEALAEDLGRFQRGEPIRARAVGRVERGLRWCRRRPVPAGLLAALVLAFLGSLYFWHEAVNGKQLAVEKQQQADEARRQAEDHVRLLRQLLNTNLEISGNRFLQKPGGRSVSRELLDQAEAACTQLLEQRGDDPELQQLLALVLTNQGYQHLGRWQVEKAMGLYQRALDLWDQLPPEAAAKREAHLGRMNTLCGMGGAYQLRNCEVEALPMFEQAYRLCRELAAEAAPLDNRPTEAVLGVDMACTLEANGRFEEARRWFSSSYATLEELIQDMPHNARLLCYLGRCCTWLARGPSDPLAQEAAERYEQAYQAQREAVLADPADGRQRCLLTEFASSLCASLYYSSRADAAVETWRRHLHWRDELLKLHPVLLKDDTDLLEDLLALCGLHRAARQREAVLATAREIAAALARNPTVPERDWDRWPYFYKTTAAALRHYGAGAEALCVAEEYVQRFQRLAQQEPKNLRYAAALSEAWWQVSKARWDLEQWEEALAALRQAVAVQSQVVAQAPASVLHRELLGDLHVRLTRKLCELGRLDEAKQCVRERQRLWPNNVEKLRSVQRDLQHWAARVGEAGRELSPKEQVERQRYLELRAWVAQEFEALLPAENARAMASGETQLSWGSRNP
jgi:serine/threonine-protein kinase